MALLRWSLVVSVLFVFAGMAKAEIYTIEQACQGDSVLYQDGMCICRGTGEAFDPRVEPDEIKLCQYAERLKAFCQDPSGYLEYRSDRCYCKKTRAYLTGAINTALEGSRSLSEVSLLHEWDKALSTLEKKKSDCLAASQAISLYLQLGYPEGTIQEVFPSGDLAALHKAWKGLPKITRDQDPGAKTVKITQKVAGSYGGWIYRIQNRKGSPQNWAVDVTDHPGEQGTPILGVKELGPILGEFFGFKLIHDHLIEFPDVTELNARIDRMNQLILESRQKTKSSSIDGNREPNTGLIKVHFFEAPEGAVDVDTYLRKFFKEGMIPVATAGADGDQTYLMHDLGLHVAAFLLIPNRVMNLVKMQAQFIFEFESFMAEKSPGEFSDPQFKRVLQKIRLSKVMDIDFGSAAYLYRTDFRTEVPSLPGISGSLFQTTVRVLMGSAGRTSSLSHSSVREYFQSIDKNFD